MVDWRHIGSGREIQGSIMFRFFIATATLLLSFVQCSIPGYEMRSTIEDPHDKVLIWSQTCCHGIDGKYYTRIKDLYFTAVYRNDADLLKSILRGLGRYHPDSLEQRVAEQTCFKYAVEHDYFDIAKILIENSMVFDKLPNVLKYISKRNRNVPQLFLLLDDIIKVTDIRDTIKTMVVECLLSAESFLTDGPYSELLLHSGYLLMQAVEIDSVPLAKKCLALAPTKTEYPHRAYSCPLEKAIASKNSEMIKLLVNHGIPINRTFGRNKTALGYFIYCSFNYNGDSEVTNDTKEVIRFFLDEVKVDPYKDYELEINNHSYTTTVIGHAILLNNPRLIRFLLECGISSSSRAFSPIWTNYSRCPRSANYDVEQALSKHRMLDQFKDYFPDPQPN